MPVSNQDKLEAILYEALSPFLAALAFIPFPKLNQYRLIGNDGFQCVIYSWSHYDELSLLEIQVGIRIDAVESLIYPLSDGLSGFGPDSMTLVTPLSKLRGKRHQRYKIESEEDVRKAAKEIVEWLREDGLPFLDRYSQLEAMDELFNDQPEKLLPYIHSAANRCLRGITLAKLTGRDDFERLVRVYRQQLQLQRAANLTLARYDQLVDLLRQYLEN
jgi:hypothetical protein